MNPNTGVNVRWPVLAIAAALLIAVGAGATYFVLRPASRPESEPAATATAQPMTAASSPAGPASPSGAPLPDVVVPLSPEAVKRAAITVATVGVGSGSSGLRQP